MHDSSKIFRSDRKYVVGVRTPCSGDFQAEAERAAGLVGLPLRWMDALLDNLESVIKAALEQKAGVLPCRK
jgi:hypothetical protein